MALVCFRFVQEVNKVYHYELDANLNYDTLKSTDGVITFSPKEPLFFGSVQKIREALSRIKEKSFIKIDLSEVVFIDLSGAFALNDAVKSFKKSGYQSLSFFPNL